MYPARLPGGAFAQNMKKAGHTMNSTSTGMICIAMWTGPRSISTAMLRSWENRPDCVVVDEPLYAHYLVATGKNHPMASEVIAAYETDWKKVVESLTKSEPAGAKIFYQKHMAHQLLPEMGRDWIDQLTNCLLIRDPQEMIASYIGVNGIPKMEDLGFPQLVEIYERVLERTGAPPPIVDARDVLVDPRGTLGLLCKAVGVDFVEAMLSWPPGGRDSDNIQGPHWYGDVMESTGFNRYLPKPNHIPDHLSGLLAECKVYYDRLYADRLVVKRPM